MDKIYKLDEYDMCCPQDAEKCPVDNSCNNWKDQYDKYLELEKCKPEEKFEFNLCDYDPNEIYFMQYRSKRAFYNETVNWDRIFDNTFDKTFE